MTSQDEQKVLADKLWFTFKARIKAYERLNSNNLHSQLALVWYAFISAVLSIIVIRHQTYLGPDTDIILASLSVAILLLSLLVTNFDFKGKAFAFRQNYLDIQGLYNDLTVNNPTAQSVIDISKSYQELLKESDNHSEIDDKYFRAFNKTSRPVTIREKGEVYLYLIARFIILVIVYVSPALLLFKFGF